MRASADGPPRCVSPDGRTSAPSGACRCRASPSRAPASKRDSTMNDTSGPPATSTSSHADRVSLWESRLRARTAELGSTLYKLTWKRQDMPSGRSFFLLRASGRRASGTEYSGWPTPTTVDDRRGSLPPRPWDTGVPLTQAAVMTGWPTPRLSDGEKAVRSAAGSAAEMARKGSPQDLCQGAHLSGWATPSAREARSNSASEEHHLKRLAQTRGKPLNEQAHQMTGADFWAAGWPTPRTADTTGAGISGDGGPNLRTAAHMSGPMRLTASGDLLTGCSVRTVSGGQLNVDMSRWLMGYPEAWARSAPGWLDWQWWQVVMRSASSAPSDTVSDPCEAMATP